MSHYKIKVQNQTPNQNGEINLSVSNIGSLTSTSSKFLGVDASSDLVQLDTPTASESSLSWTPVYHWFSFLANWGGPNQAISVDQIIYFRVASGSPYQNTSYISFTDGNSPFLLNGVWGNRFNCQAGTYLFNFSFAGRVNSSSDEVVIRLKNRTDNTIHGNKLFWGSAEYSNNLYAYVTIASAKSFEFVVESVTGTPTHRNSTGLMSYRLNIWRL